MEAFAAQFEAAEGGGDRRVPGDGPANPNEPWEAHLAGHGPAGSARASAAETARAIVGILGGPPATEQYHRLSQQPPSRNQRPSPAVSNDDSEDDDAEGSDDPDYAPGGQSRSSGNHRRRSSATSEQRSSFSSSLGRGERPPVFDTKGQMLPKQRKYITVRW